MFTILLIISIVLLVIVGKVGYTYGYNTRKKFYVGLMRKNIEKMKEKELSDLSKFRG